MTTSKLDPNRWVVSKGRNRALSKPLVAEVDTQRFTTLANTIRDLHTEEDVVSEIDKLWSEAQEKFLAIGRYLIGAKAKFHRSYEAIILPQLPFGRGVAFQLRAIAMAVDEGRLLEEEMPRSYATAYQLVSLPRPHFDLARQENLVRRDVMRREVEAFRTKLRSEDPLQQRISLQRERDRLEAEVTRMSARLLEIKAALAE